MIPNKASEGLVVVTLVLQAIVVVIAMLYALIRLIIR
jgi:hypothetical protein